MSRQDQRILFSLTFISAFVWLNIFFFSNKTLVENKNVGLSKQNLHKKRDILKELENSDHSMESGQQTPPIKSQLLNQKRKKKGTLVNEGLLDDFLYGDNFQIHNEILYPNSEEAEKLILIYNKFYGFPEWFGDHFTKDGVYYRFEHGGYSCSQKCAFVYDKNFVEDADAILFHFIDNRYFPEKPPVPEKRSQNQIWIGYTLESSYYYGTTILDLPLDYLLNWTMTYRLDSDIWSPYGRFFKTNETQLDFNNESLPEPKLKKKMVAALISNCDATNGRMELIQELHKYIPVDLYGKCGIPCPTTNCRQYLAENYNFFMAFENSLCQDYITEKFFESLQLGMIPIVYGLANYKQMAPSNSYINILDFPSLKSLSNYLLYLTSNKGRAAYEEYFGWKLHYKLHMNSLDPFCDICKKLSSPQGYMRKQYFSFGRWWMSKRPSASGDAKAKSRLIQHVHSEDEQQNMNFLSAQYKNEFQSNSKACIQPEHILNHFQFQMEK